MRSARSRSGCITCRTKKVKCDEQTPECRRCKRLDLSCEWTMPTGKSRNGTASRCKTRFAPPKLLPKVDRKILDFEQDLFEMSNAWLAPLAVFPLNPNNKVVQQPDVAQPGDSVLPAECYTSDLILGDWLPESGFPFNSAELERSAVQGDSEVCMSATMAAALSCSDPAFPAIMQTNWARENDMPATISSLGTHWQNVVFSQSFSQTGRETEALHYYANIYPTMTVSKNLNWSTYKIMLRNNSQDPLTMHLLIAASLIDLAAAKNYEEPLCCAARSHAKEGMMLLKAALRPDANSDPISVMTAFFFLYRYTALVKGRESLQMADWSENVCNYVKRNRLEEICSGTAVSQTEERKESETMSQQMRTHLARLILWTFYEDVYAGMGGQGGFLARHMCDEPGRARDVYQHSSAELECFWGKEYPESEVIDDLENAPVIAFLYEVMYLYAEVNKVAFSAQSSDAEKAAVERKIRKLEACSGSLLRLTTITTQPRSRIMVNAEYIVPYFYALRIYCYRCFMKENSFEVAAPAVIQSCVNSILQLAQRCLARGPFEAVRSRFQWSLFMAGIETTDNVYKEWISSKLRSAKISEAFQLALHLQETSGKRISIALLAKIMGNQNLHQEANRNRAQR